MPATSQVANMIVGRAPGLALYARQWLDAAGAEDVVQDALAALLSQAKTPDDPVAWVCRVIRNAAIDERRSAGRRKRRERAVAEGRREWFEARPDALMDGRAAEEALKHLPEVSREIVVLRIWSDLTFAQIAGVTGLTVSSVHNRYTGALAELRGYLEKSCDEKRI